MKLTNIRAAVGAFALLTGAAGTAADGPPAAAAVVTPAIAAPALDPVAQKAAATQAALDAKITRAGYTQGKLVTDVPDYRIEGWNYIDSRHLIFTAGPSRSYLLTLMIDCYELSGSDDIGFTTTATQLTNHDEVKVRAAGGGTPRTCPIVSINELSKIPRKKS